MPESNHVFDLTPEQRKKQFKPVGYRNNDTGQVYPCADIGVLNRFAYREPSQIDPATGAARFQGLKGEGTMIVPVVTMQNMDNNKRNGTPLWTPIFDLEELNRAIEEEYGGDAPRPVLNRADALQREREAKQGIAPTRKPNPELPDGKDAFLEELGLQP